MVTLLLGGAGLLALGVLGLLWSRLASVLLVLLSLYWLYADVKPEGPLLWRVSDERGLVLTDVWGLLGLVVGVVLLVRGPGRRHR